VPEAKSRSNMVINVIKVVVNIFLPYLGLIIFMKKGGLLLKILQIGVKKIATYSFGDYLNWDNIPNYE
jgi:uncharacterized protein YacL